LHANLVVAARRSRNGGAANDLVCGFDRKSSADCNYARQRHLLADNRITIVEALGVGGRIGAEGVCCVRLAPAVFDRVGAAPSPRSCTMVSPSRFTNIAETRKPFAWQVSTAVVAMTFAASYDSNFSVFNWAFAAPVIRQAIAEVAATAPAR
jgi:hypothetical protein